MHVHSGAHGHHLPWLIPTSPSHETPLSRARLPIQFPAEWFPNRINRIIAVMASSIESEGSENYSSHPPRAIQQVLSLCQQLLQVCCLYEKNVTNCTEIHSKYWFSIQNKSSVTVYGALNKRKKALTVGSLQFFKHIVCNDYNITNLGSFMWDSHLLYLCLVT